ncbi:hypothetical protein [Deinococcus ficus]|uniref:hypothetical protein n=1 Tax=Deinococcus ficus TaxID=317577 RepID=UPI0003B38DF5|nr:hypothetical protein [Deinococcus ficus]
MRALRALTSRLARRARPLLLAAGLLGAGLFGLAEARTVKIVSADTLELRQVDGQELVVITGEIVELRVDDDVVKARRVEYNRTRRTLTLVGAASYYNAAEKQTLTGENLIVSLGDEQISGEDVLISDAVLEIRGAEVDRMPGQIRASSGYFTTCARCGRTVNDFAFRAEKLIVYPGDRLVAYRVQVLILDVPVLFLPVLVLPLNEEDRQPRFSVGQSAQDGFTALADLPFSIADNTLGTTLLRFYQNRSPNFGVGVALRSYAPQPYIDRLTLYTLLNPKPLNPDGTQNPGMDLDLNFSVTGRFALPSAEKDGTYTLQVDRRDIGLAETDPLKGVTDIRFGVHAEYPRFTADLNYVDRFSPRPITGPGAVSLGGTVLRQPELIIDPRPYTFGNFSLDFRVSAGQYTAASNPLSRSALSQGLNITTTRLEETHDLNYTATPWRDATFSVRNTFTGRYYGTGARTVDLNLTANLTQRFNVTNTLSLSAGYLRREGTSPFQFDALSGRLLSAPVALTLSTVPLKNTTFGATYSYDLFRPWEEQRLAFNVGVTGPPLSFSSALSYQPVTGVIESFTYDVTLSDPEAGTPKVTPARPATATEPAAPARIEYSSRWAAPRLTLNARGGYTSAQGPQPFTLTATVTGEDRTDNVSAYLVHDLITPGLREFGVRFNLSPAEDVVLNPILVTGSEAFILEPAARMVGTYTALWRGEYQFRHTHDLLMVTPEGSRSSGTMTFSVGTVDGRATAWSVTYGGAYDLRRTGFTAPTLDAVVRTDFGLPGAGRTLGLRAIVAIPGLDQPRLEVRRAEVQTAWQFGSRAALSANVVYNRTRTGTYPDDTATETLTLAPLRVAFAFGRVEQPDVYLTARLEQTYTWVNGIRTDTSPITPVVGVILNRCCWAASAEADFAQGRYRLAIGLPGQSFYPLLDLVDGTFRFPLLTQP